MNRRFNIVLTLVLAVGALFGGFFGDRVLATGEDEKRALEDFAQLVDVIETSYGGEVDSQAVVYGAIRGMLRTLDPHSSFLDPRTYQAMREEQRGHFSGLGIVVTKKGEQLTVISPIEDTPAFRLGIRAGDVIARIESEATREMSLDEAVSRLKGPKGTQVRITINRSGNEPFDLTITRDDIPTKSVSRAFLVRPGVGYLRIKNFTQTTADEVQDAVEKLRAEGMEGLVLDLRHNPGGLLDQAVRVADLFIGAGQTVVFTKGRLADANHTYVAETGERVEHPVVVLVNQGSASASEIVAGAIQDHDRGLIAGGTTWGKGLVQSVYTLKYRAGLALTTAKYYTPSGRSIQRDYSGSFEDYYDHEEAAERGPDRSHPARTDMGRTVYGGGGIIPDVMVAMPEAGDVEQKLERHDAFFKFSVEYVGRHRDIGRDFVASDETMKEFRSFLAAEKVDLDEQAFALESASIRTQLEEKVVAALYGLEEAARRGIQSDPQVVRAIELIPEARELRNRMQQLLAAGRARPPEIEDNPATHLETVGH